MDIASTYQKHKYLYKLKTVEQVTELYVTGSEGLPEPVMCQSKVLQDAEVQEDVVETLEIIVAEIQLVQRLVKRAERSLRN